MSVVLGMLIFLPACFRALAQTNEPEDGYRRISASEAFDMMMEFPQAIILDVRTEGEFRARRIDGSILIPHNEIASRAAGELPDKNALILVYCQSGARSEQAARTLLGLAYTNVFDFGGINNWRFSTVSGN